MALCFYAESLHLVWRLLGHIFNCMLKIFNVLGPTFHFLFVTICVYCLSLSRLSRIHVLMSINSSWTLVGSFLTWELVCLCFWILNVIVGSKTLDILFITDYWEHTQLVLSVRWLNLYMCLIDRGMLWYLINPYLTLARYVHVAVRQSTGNGILLSVV